MIAEGFSVSRVLFWERLLNKLREECQSNSVERYCDILPFAEPLNKLEGEGRTGTVPWARALESVAYKVVDEWPYQDELGREMLTYIQAARKQRR